MDITDSNGVISIPPSNYNFDSRGIGRMYYDAMLKNQNKIALINGVTGNTITYKEMLKRAIRASVALKKDGVKPGDVIAIYCYNHMDTTTLLIGGFFVNAVVVGIDNTSPLERVVTVLKQIKPKVIFVADSVLHTLTDAVTQLSLITKIVVMDCFKKNYNTLTDFLQASLQEEETFEPVNAKSLHDTAMIFFTSGTTGTPKGVCRSHLSLLYPHYNIMNLGFCWDVILHFSTPAWVAYLNYVSIAIFQGTTRVVYNKFLPEYIHQLAPYKVTCMFATLWRVLQMCHYGSSKTADTSFLKTLITGGTVLSQTRRRQIQEIFRNVRICNNYGQTEIGTIFLQNPTNKNDFKLVAEKPESVGQGLPGVSYKIVDLGSGRVLGPNEKGELLIKTVYPLGYYFKTNSSMLRDKDGWYKTGDLAYYDDNFCFYIVDRIKETFKFRHYVIVPSFLEEVLLQHPAVDMAFVTGVSHHADDEHPIGVVTLKNGFEDVTSKDIEKYVAKRVLDHQRFRAGVKIVDKFVMTTSGKIDRNYIRNSIRNNSWSYN
ncbi:hypothetical protein RN001_015493 [Aquatica leii]|uniref:Luciferin 4-monooxygenase n=1 Tax=Aquatica leii TaxID=1421715 RepID=A0AAN7SDE2_9COLE|nr:hypothetical protein RN001_015493 [Aquatica leii]